ncbi:hypothetical protein NDI56_01095 [Haloarcula sp. S1CR25-12]|uniref:Protein kinase domain-containing protein n=1 Tax=Haloarcula saliterrae TaxID=2950534 RepID=A0ABU2F6U7_9EURY|nr:hypothetical protein [Haloarcula sp. S1CR25-12]MDS0257998.1 hypothetical protein [Haloarcula sp. S1CR25-12]
MQPDIPRRPPLELVKQRSLWVVEDYRKGSRTGKTHATLDSRLSALRYAKSKMEADRHPCLVRWDTPRSVGGLYWNPLFDCLTVRRDDLVGGWTVVPQAGTCAMTAAESREAAADRAKKLQRLYDFKQLRVYDGRDEEYEARDHRFLRNDITRSGVRFDAEAVAEPAAPDEPDPGTASAAEPAGPSDVGTVGPASPGQLGASVPDVTQVEFTDTDGAVHLYSTPWSGGTRAQIVTVSRKHATDDGVPEAFAGVFERWQAHDDAPHVASIYESGTDPTSWVAYRVGRHTLADIGTELPARSRLEILGHVADAVGTVTAGSAPTCGVSPDTIHLLESDGSRRATVADWGIEWTVRDALGLDTSGPYTAPEQLDGRLTPTTPVYQLGAVAYWLLCASTPPDRPSPDVGSIPRPIQGISKRVKPHLARALLADPDERFDTAEAFYGALVDAA